jgi:hypothetical protein
MLASVLLLLLTHSEVGTPTTDAVVDALEEVFGPDVRVLVRGLASTPDDETSARMARDDRARAAVRLSWVGSGRDEAFIVVSFPDGRGRLDRHLVFAPSDPPRERGRAVGFVVASILLPPAPRPAAPVAKPAPIVALASATPAPPPRWGLDVYGDATVPLDGHGTGLGVGLGTRFRVGERWGMRLGFCARSATLEAAQASSLELSLSAGAYRTLYATRSDSFSIAGRVEGLVLRQGLTHFSDDDPRPVEKGRLVAGTAQLLELAWRLTPALVVHGAVGAEETLGSTRVVVHEETVAQIAIWRMVAELGVRARF